MTSFSTYHCRPGPARGPEAHYTYVVEEHHDLELTLESDDPDLFLVVLSPAGPRDPHSCLATGRQVFLPATTPGDYLVIVDGPDAEGADFRIRRHGAPDLDCSAATEIECNQRLSGDTTGAPDNVTGYDCSGETYDGGEVVFDFGNPVGQTISFSIDDSADADLDLFLLDACNENSCLELDDTTFSLDLGPGNYFLVVDGRNGAEGPFEITVTCANSLTPGTLEFDIGAGECVDENKVGFLTPRLNRADVMFAIDLTNSMQEERDALADNMVDIIDRLERDIDDLAFGLISYRDYPDSGIGRDPCFYNIGGFGNADDWPYRLDQPVTVNRADILAAVTGLPDVGGGGDRPEAAARVLHELANDPAIAWRNGSRRIAVHFGDTIPHDCNVLECLGDTAIALGVDPGRDEMPESGDEIFVMDAIQDLLDNFTSIVHLHSGDDRESGVEHFAMWECWTARTGGRVELLNDDGTVPSGIDLVTLIGDVIAEQATSCSSVSLRTSPGYEDWLVDDGGTLTSVTLPASVEFDIRICAPEDAPEGLHEFEIDLLCAGGFVASQTVRVNVLPCEPTIDALPPTEIAICLGESVDLDASGIQLARCGGSTNHVWFDSEGMPMHIGESVTVMPTESTTYMAEIRCSSDSECVYTHEISVDVQEAPTLGTGTVVDLDTCSLGVELTWDAAVFRDPAGTGTYSIYRSELSCEDALTQPPVLTGLTETTVVERGLTADTTYFYVVEAEESRTTAACMPIGPNNGGAVVQLCLGEVTETDRPPFPDGVYTTLFVANRGEEIRAHWETARDLERREGYHLLKAVNHPTEPYTQVNPMGDLSRDYVETDTSARIQFFDLRVDTDCGDLSIDEYPPTLP
ncbi:MAG: vWA domain-containing protein [Acidobacteriota bacterium]